MSLQLKIKYWLLKRWGIVTVRRELEEAHNALWAIPHLPNNPATTVGSTIARACVDDAIGILDWQLRGGEGIDIVEVGRQ